MICRYTSKTTPRVLADHHQHGCAGDPCTGCLPCPQPHCRVCTHAHHSTTCAECVAETRAALHDIGRMTGSLSEEVEHRGINGEAMVLLGPAVDPEQLGHVQASIAAGRLPADYLDHADHELHPLFVLGKWDMTYRDALDHDEDDTVTIASAIDYLDRQLTYAAGFEHVEFEKFSDQVKASRNHLLGVLHDRNQGDIANVGCFQCGGKLERKLTDHDGFEDWWTCMRCRCRYTTSEYYQACRSKLEAAAG